MDTPHGAGYPFYSYCAVRHWSIDMIHSLTALDHLEGMYACWCEGMHVNDLFGFVYGMMERRGMLNDPDGIKEAAYYIDCFEYSQSPADPAFCYECKRVLEWINSPL